MVSSAWAIFKSLLTQATTLYFAALRRSLKLSKSDVFMPAISDAIKDLPEMIARKAATTSGKRSSLQGSTVGLTPLGETPAEVSIF